MTRPLRAALTDVLRTTFPQRVKSFDAAGEIVAVFEAACADVGDLVVEEEDGEITITIGRHYHAHFGPDDLPVVRESAGRGRTAWKHEIADPDAQQAALCDRVKGFLTELFAHRVLIWSLPNERAAAIEGFTGELPPGISNRATVFVWSRVLKF